MNLVVADATLGNDSVLAGAMFDLLKNTRELEYMAHQFHWNIIGVKFNTMHEFYEEEYKQLFEDQDEIAEQIRQQGFFVPVINNVLLEENYAANDFEEQLIAYSDKLTQNIALIDKVNDLAKNEIAIQDMCARLKGLRSLSLNLKVKAMLGANKMSLEPSEANVVESAAVVIAKPKRSYTSVTKKELDIVTSVADDLGLESFFSAKYEGSYKGYDVDIEIGDDYIRVELYPLITFNVELSNRSKDSIKKEILDKFDEYVSREKETASAVTAGFDKARYKEVDEESKFFKILKNDCDIRAKNFYAINKGLRLAIKVIKGTFENASIRFFALKKKGGYVRVELKDKVYIIGYTIYESGKIKVWTRELKTNVPVNSFDYDMLNMYAKPFGTKMITGMLPTWMSI